MVQTRLLQRGANSNRLSLHVVSDAVRTQRRATAARLQRCSLPFQQRAFSDPIKRLARQTMLETEGRHRPARRIIRPLGDRETNTRINRFNSAHPSNIEGEVSPRRAPELSPIY